MKQQKYHLFCIKTTFQFCSFNASNRCSRSFLVSFVVAVKQSIFIFIYKYECIRVCFMFVIIIILWCYVFVLCVHMTCTRFLLMRMLGLWYVEMFQHLAPYSFILSSVEPENPEHHHSFQMAIIKMAPSWWHKKFYAAAISVRFDVHIYTIYLYMYQCTSICINISIDEKYHRPHHHQWHQ